MKLENLKLLKEDMIKILRMVGPSVASFLHISELSILCL